MKERYLLVLFCGIG